MFSWIFGERKVPIDIDTERLRIKIEFLEKKIERLEKCLIFTQSEIGISPLSKEQVSIICKGD